MATQHVKPTQEELDKGIQDALEELDKPEVPEIPEVPENEPPTPPEPPVEPEAKPSEPEPEVELKKKLSNSARENQVLHARTKKFDEAVDNAAQITDVSDEEAVKEYPEWDVMDDVAKKMAKDSIVNKRRFQMIHEASKEGKNIQEWHDKVDKYLEDPKTLIDNPKLEGKGDDFKIFATKPTRRGLDFEDLTSAFLYEVDKNAKPKSKGAMFETGSGGPNENPKPKGDKISLMEARSLMKSDYNKYKEYLLAGKIEDIVRTRFKSIQTSEMKR
jgi:hypothetical protein